MAFSLDHRPATPADAALLATLNRQLIEDEGHRNTMNLRQLENRMRAWLAGEYVATLFERAEDVVAYALWRDDLEWISLRQFFVARAFRREGVGGQAIEMLRAKVWPPKKRVRVEVLSTNQAGLHFWRSVGFDEYAITLEMERG